MARRYSLFLDTGSSRGALYNHTGQSLTDGINGAGTNMVGGWSRDFTCCGFAGPSGRPISRTNELSFIVADGRVLRSGSLDSESDPYEADFDTDEEPSDNDQLVQDGDDYIGIKGLHVRLSALRPAIVDSAVYAQDAADGELVQVSSLVNWLDALRDVPDEALNPDLVDFGPRWQHLRVPIHWALYKVPVQPTSAPKLQEMVANNSNAPVTVEGLLSYGPFGMLSRMYGTTYAATNYVRLWDMAKGIRLVDKGEAEVPFDLSFYDNTQPQPDDRVDSDIVEMDITSDPSHHLPNTAGVRGSNFHLSFRSRRFISLRPDEVLIFHVCTGRARLTRDEEDSAYTIMGPAGSPTDSDEPDRVRAGGPLLSWYRWTAGAWHYDSPPRRRTRRR